MDDKTCGKCKALKPRSEFTKNVRTNDGLCNRCKPCALAEVEAYAERNKEKISARRAERYAANKELFAARNAEQKRKFADKRRAEARARYAANREQILIAKRRYHEENRETVKATRAKVRAKRKAAPGTHTADDIRSLMRTQRGLCIGCRRDIRDEYHVDHIEPLAKGGTNDRANLQLLCPTCNRRKHARHPADFMRDRGFLL